MKRYTEPDRYPYHFHCTQILPVNATPLYEGQTHSCWCSAWKQLEDGTFLHWRDGAWREPKRGAIKSKPISDLMRKYVARDW